MDKKTIADIIFKHTYSALNTWFGNDDASYKKCLEISEEIVSQMQLPVKPANGVNISEDKECDSIILEKSGLRYECYFDKKYHQIFVGEPQNGSLISIGTPDNLAGTLKVEYYPKF